MNSLRAGNGRHLLVWQRGSPLISFQGPRTSGRVDHRFETYGALLACRSPFPASFDGMGHLHRCSSERRAAARPWPRHAIIVAGARCSHAGSSVLFERVASVYEAWLLEILAGSPSCASESALGHMGRPDPGARVAMNASRRIEAHTRTHDTSLPVLLAIRAASWRPGSRLLRRRQEIAHQACVRGTRRMLPTRVANPAWAEASFPPSPTPSTFRGKNPAGPVQATSQGTPLPFLMAQLGHGAPSHSTA